MRPPGIKTIAQNLGVSTATVSDVLNGKARVKRIALATEARVLAEAQRLDYRPNLLAKSLAQQESKLLALMFQDLHYSMAEVLSTAAMRVLEEAGYNVILGVSHWSAKREREQMRAMLDRRVDGALVLPLQENADFYRKLKQPVVQFLDWIDGVDLPCVALDGAQAARDLVEHLFEFGHRHLGFLGVKTSSPGLGARYEGFLQACAERGLRMDRHDVEFGRVSDPESIREVGLRMLSRGSAPTAVVAVGDPIALQFLQALRGTPFEGKVAVAGIGDMPNLGATLSLTSVSEPYEQIGTAAAHLLLRLLAGKPVPKKPTLIRGELHPRHSTLSPGPVF